MKQQIVVEEPPRQALPGEEPTNSQVVNAVVWAIDKLGSRIVGFSEGMESRAGRIEERLGRIEEKLDLLHEERGRARAAAQEDGPPRKGETA